MICPHCAAVVSDQAAFCIECGGKLEPQKARRSGSGGRTALGIVLIALGIITYFLNPLFTVSLISQQVGAYGGNAVAALSMISHVFELMLSAILFSGSVITILAGVALLCRKNGVGKLVLFSGMVNGMLVFAAILAVALVYLLPELWIGLYSTNAAVLQAVKNILYQGTTMLPFLVVLFLRIGICLLLAVGQIVAFFVLRSGTEFDDRADRGTLAVMLAVLLLALFDQVKDLEITVLIGKMVGSGALTAYSTARAALPDRLLALLFVTVTVWALCTVKWKTWIRVLPAIGMVLVTLVAVCVYKWESLSTFLYFDGGEILQKTYNAALVLFGGAVVMFVGYIFWVCSASKGAIPCWLQGVACVVFAVHYLLCAVTVTAILHAALPLASLSTAGGMVILAVVANVRHAAGAK